MLTPPSPVPPVPPLPPSQTLPGSQGDPSSAGAPSPGSPSSRSRRPTNRRRRGGTLLVVAAQSQLDGARWQVYPAYMSAVACTLVDVVAGAGVDVHPFLCKIVAGLGGVGALVSTAAGVFAPVFLMPKPTGPYRTGKTTRLWIDATRRSWLLRSKARIGKIPESRMLMANVWYPAAAPRPRLRRERRIDRKKDKNNDNASGSNLGREDDDGYVSGSDGGCDSGDDLGKHWPDDEAAKVHYEAMAQEKLLQAQVLGSPDGKRRGAGADAGGGVSIPDRITIANARKAEARRRRRRQRGKRTHWLEPTLATTMAVSFALPGWIVDYFRLVRMEARVDVPVADPPAASSSLDGVTEGFPLVLFSHSFTGMKEQNSSLLQELASWGHIVVAVDHPHDAALVLYPDGSTADFRGYDMPMESEPRNWWRFRHEHARWRALDLAHALERIVDANGDPDSPLHRKVDLTRVAAVGHSFGGAACLMLAQMDPRITSVVLMDPWMWPLGKESTVSGAPCPLLVLEAPEFLWDRDIFCVNNGEMSSLLCAATAPQCAGLRPAHGPGSEPPTPSKAPRRIGDRFDDMVGDDGRERRRDEDGDGEHQHRHPGPSGWSGGGGTGAGESESALDRARARDLALAQKKESASGAGIDPATAGEDPAHAHAPPGFIGASVDGFKGVGFYTEDGFYHAGSPPATPTSVRQGIFRRPQHPRSSSQDNLAAMGDGGGSGSHAGGGSQAGSLVRSRSGSRSNLLGRAGSSGGLGIEAGTAGSGGEALARSGSSSGWTEILDAVNPPATTTDGGGDDGGGSNGGPPLLAGCPPARTDSWESLLAPFRGHRGTSGGTSGALRRSRANSFNSSFSDWDGSHLGTRDPSGIAFKAVVDAAMHFDFTDMAMVAPLTTTMLGWVGRGGRDVHDVSSACVLRFLRSFNHAREPDAAAPDASDLERLRAGLLSRTPVSEVLPARQWGFAGGHAFGAPHGRVVAAKTSSSGGGLPDGRTPHPDGQTPHPNPNPNTAEPVGGGAGPSERKGPLSPLRNKLKMPPLPIPDRLRRVRAPRGRPPRSGAPTSSSSSEAPSPAERARRARLLRQYRRSFDATHVPENWMELESIASDSDGETPDGDDDDDDDGGYASGDDEPKTPAGVTGVTYPTNADDGGGNDESFEGEFATPTARLGFPSAAGDGESPGFVSAESSPISATTGLPAGDDARRERPDDPGGSGSTIDRGDGPGRVGRGGSGVVPEPSTERAPPRSIVEPGSPYPEEVKPRGVRWVKSHEWALAADREWTESQRREMRWLLHEATARGVRLQPSDFVAMFPSFDSAAIRRAAVEELTTLHAHPPPKPLVWMSQMIVDESGELRSKHDRPH